MIVSTSARFYFDSYQAAAAGLLAVLLDAKTTDADYRFGGLDVASLYTSGLLISGDISAISDILEKIPGVVRQSE